MKMISAGFLLALSMAVTPLAALELQGFVTKDCQRHVGLIVHATEESVQTIGLDGLPRSFSSDEIEVLYVYNIIENPFAVFKLDQAALAYLKAIYLDDDKDERSLAFPVRFIEDLIIFYSLDGKSHVHRMADIFKLRPAPLTALGEHRPHSYRNPGFEFTEQAGRCPVAASPVNAVKPTRVLANKISIAEFLSSFADGYNALESFQERTYLYAKPLVFEQGGRLGITIMGDREEPAIPLPVSFQWATGEPYRFQSFNVIGMKNHEITPTTEPVFSLRSDVKSHAFHGIFIGNVAGISAGTKMLVDAPLELKGRLTVQPTFNYLAMMGGDYGPYSASIGFYYPTFGIKVGNEQREILGRSASYALRAMYTKRNFRFRAIGSLTDYQSGAASENDVLAQTGQGRTGSVQTYKFNAVFFRGGVDYDFSKQLRMSVDGIYVGGDYKETRVYEGNPAAQPSDITFKKLTTQLQVRQSFGNYVSISGYANLIQNNYESNFLNKDEDREQRETRFFGTLEFVF